MKWVEVWEQGYQCNSQGAPATCVFRGLAKDFEDACQKVLKKRLADPEGWGPASYHSYENGIHRWWGCAWFPTRREAL